MSLRRKLYNEGENLETFRPWNGPWAHRYADEIEEHKPTLKTSVLYGRTTDERKMRALKIVYWMLKNNYSVTNREINSAVQRDGYDGPKVKEIVATLGDALPVWDEDDDETKGVVWYGLLDRENVKCEELENGY